MALKSELERKIPEQWKNGREKQSQGCAKQNGEVLFIPRGMIPNNFGQDAELGVLYTTSSRGGERERRFETNTNGRMTLGALTAWEWKWSSRTQGWKIDISQISHCLLSCVF